MHIPCGPRALRRPACVALAAFALALASPGVMAQPQAQDDPIAALLAGEARKTAPVPAPRKADALPENKARPAMWRLSDADSEITLLGSFHILPASLDWRSPALLAAADKAETVWFEAETDTPAAQAQTQNLIRREGFLPKGETLSARLGAEGAQSLAAVAKEIALPLPVLDTMRPWQAFLVLSVRFIAAQGFEPGAGVEAALVKEARARGRNLRFFESVGEQLGFFTGFAPDTEKDLLLLLLENWEGQKAEFDDLYNAWRKGEAETIDALMNKAMRESAPEVYETLIAKRNERWARVIAKEMEGAGKTLVVVGAAHLVGEDSVPALLREMGYEVERIDG